MADKQKVADLAKDERDALINTAKELGIRGLYDNMYVETLQNKIDAAKAENGSESYAAEAVAEDEKPDDNGNEKAEEAEAEDEEVKAPKITHAEGKIYEPEEQQKKAPETKAKICHICRSKVINGVCTGCGFKLKK